MNKPNRSSHVLHYKAGTQGAIEAICMTESLVVAWIAQRELLGHVLSSYN